ncbi:hypothetical protein JCM10207_005584 [Rhodosporidiobolus poonsookiae]
MSSSAPESFAVIGGEGFLGAALIDELHKRHPVSQVASFGLTQRHFSPDGYRFFRTDITSLSSLAASLRDSGATTVFHTASPHALATPEVWQKVNVEGTKLVIRACREAGVKKLVFTSSMTVAYEFGVDMKNVDERLPRINTDGPATYEGTKAQAEELILAANGKDGLLTCSLRLGGLIGPGDRQVLPGFVGVYNSGQSAFQMGSNQNLFDFVTVKNAVHAHLLAAERLDALPLPASSFNTRLPPVASTVPRRALPSSRHPDVVDRSSPPAEQDPPLPASRNRFNQFFDVPEPLAVAGQAFYITNGEPVPFWSMARAVYHAYSGRPQRWWDPIVLPGSVGMFFATLSEWAGWLQGKRPLECGVNRAYMQFVLVDMYCDIERARRMLGYEPVETLADGIKSGVEWYKLDEAKQQQRQREQAKSK